MAHYTRASSAKSHFSRASSAKSHVSRVQSAKTHLTDGETLGDAYVNEVSDAFLTEVETDSDREDDQPVEETGSGEVKGNAISSDSGEGSDSESEPVEPSKDSSSDYDTDLETELESEVKLEDLTGVELYLKLCEKLSIVPLSCVKSNINKTHFHMPHRGIGARGVQALTPPISQSPNARYLNLMNNMIGPDGCSYLAQIVNSNVYITELNLSYNQLGSRGMTELCLPIRDSSTLVNVDISNNDFEDKDAPLIADIIENNISLRSLNLSKNMFSIEAGKILGVAIANNDTLESLDISWNAIRLAGAEAFAKGVAGNLGLKTLNLSMNGFSTEGTRAIGIALSLNKYLENLDLSYNRVSNAAAVDFARYFKINCTLRTVKLFGNPIMYDGAQEILKTIAENERSVVHSLDLTGLMVHQEFVDLVKSLNAERPFHAEYGVVSQGKNIEGTVDRFADKNPLEILLIFMGEQNLRLVDLFRTFDKDQSGGLTRDEFIVGLQEINTPLSRSQLDELLDMLDKDGDGEIDLKEILNINREYRDIKMKASRFVQEEKLQKKLEKEGKKETELEAFTKEALAIKQRSQTTVGETTTEAFGAGASNQMSSISAPPTAMADGMKTLDDTDGGQTSAEVPAEQTSQFAVTKEEAEELNAQVKTIKTKGALSMWKSKALV